MNLKHGDIVAIKREFKGRYLLSRRESTFEVMLTREGSSRVHCMALDGARGRQTFSFIAHHMELCKCKWLTSEQVSKL